MRIEEDKQNEKVICPICGTKIVTATDSIKTECPKCGYKYELETD